MDAMTLEQGQKEKANVENCQLSATELTAKFIQFDTQNPGTTELALAKYIYALLSRAGLSPEVYFSSAGRPNVYCKKNASLPVTGKVKSLLFQGHMDTVPAKREEWDYDPHCGEVIDGFLWGVGAIDMKSGLAMMVRAFIEYAQKDLPYDLVLMCFADEERGGIHGAKFMVKEHPELFKGIDYAIGEFGGFPLYLGKNKVFMVQVDEKRPLKIALTFQGVSGHGSITKNAVVTALSDVLNALTSYISPICVTENAKRNLLGLVKNFGVVGTLLTGMLKVKWLEKTAAKIVLKLSKGMVRSILTNAYTIISVNTSGDYNVSASSAEIKLDVRVLPNVENSDVLKELNTILGKHSEKVDIQIIEDNVDVKRYETDYSLYPFLKEVLVNREPDAAVSPMILPASTDAKHLRSLGIQTYGFIPINTPKGFRFMDLIHSKNERIPVESIEFGYQCLLDLLEKLKYQ